MNRRNRTDSGVGRLLVDASFAVYQNAKSQSGSVGLFGDGVVFAKSKKQTIVSKSSTEAEIVALSDNASEAIEYLNFLRSQGIMLDEPMVIEQDNQSAMLMVERGKTHNPVSKHINVRYFFIKDRIDSGEIKLVYVPTEDLLADILTKPLQGLRFRQLRDRLLNRRKEDIKE